MSVQIPEGLEPRPSRIPFAEVAAIAAANPTRYAPVLMERYGIPRTTANRWVREARLRGHLTSNLDRPCRTCGGSGIMRYGNKG